MNIYDLIFYLFAAVTLLSAFFVVTTKNIVYSAFYLLFTFFGVTGIYVLLGADFVAITQLIVYVGGILVLLLFGVMLTNKITDVQIKTGVWQLVPSGIAVGLLGGFIMASFLGANWKSYDVPIPASTANGLGMLLMQEYIIVFELLGMLLLIALIGAASLARK